jgi:DNA modification methylase
MNHQLHHGDCLEVLKTMADNSVDSIVTDPPYGLSFMGKKWDYDVPSEDVWRECLRVLKPGGHLLAFAGTRTQHRMAVRIEDAGFEIRDMIAWVYGSGFPKSANVSKMIDQQEKNKWSNISKAIDNIDHSGILTAWKEHSKTASNAGLLFRSKSPEVGLPMPCSGFVLGNVVLLANPENTDAVALVAELSLCEARHTTEGILLSAQSCAESSTTESKSPATIVASQPASPGATLDTRDSFALESAWGWQDENTADKLKAAEALMIWLGSKPSSRQGDTAALCAALTEDLKVITLSQSKTFQNFDTTRQTECASAITATITESTAASLISFTVDTLKSKSIDKAAGAEREVIGKVAGMGKQNPEWNGTAQGRTENSFRPEYDATSPATEAAKQWQGWGTALKPALEPITVARKPLGEKTVAANVLEHGTGAINVDGCRVAIDMAIDDPRLGGNGDWSSEKMAKNVYEGGYAGVRVGSSPQGRWPANLIHDGSDEVVGLFPQTHGHGSKVHSGSDKGIFDWGTAKRAQTGGEPGSAARFFYCAKASKKDRDEGCEGMPVVTHQSGMGGAMPTDDDGNARDRFKAESRNHHPTVKPTALMRYLCRLVTPPGGVVLDPFMGSGSTGKAAVLEGFHFIGIEREAEYLQIAKARIEREPAQKQLL